jgi:hypothetical protein
MWWGIVWPTTSPTPDISQVPASLINSAGPSIGARVGARQDRRGTEGGGV